MRSPVKRKRYWCDCKRKNCNKNITMWNITSAIREYHNVEYYIREYYNVDYYIFREYYPISNDWKVWPPCIQLNFALKTFWLHVPWLTFTKPIKNQHLHISLFRRNNYVKSDHGKPLWSCLTRLVAPVFRYWSNIKAYLLILFNNYVKSDLG